MEGFEAFVTQLQSGAEPCAGMLLLSHNRRATRSQGARPSRCRQMGHRQNSGVDMETSPTGPTPLHFSFFFILGKFPVSRNQAAPNCTCQCTPPRVLPHRAVHRLAGKSHKAAVEPSHRKSLLKQRGELQKANSVSTEKKLILCSCLNKLYSFPSGTFIPVYSTTSEII